MRNKFYKLIFLTIAFLCVAFTGFADKYTHAGASFSLGSGARSEAMGGAFVGLADNIEAIYWNPAGLNNIQRAELTGMYSLNLDFDRSYNFVAYAHKLPFGVLGIHWINSGVSDIALRDNNDNSLGKKDFSSNAIGISYANKYKNLKFGLSGKYYSENIVNEDKPNGFGFDLGLQYQIIDPLAVGLSVRDAFGKVGDTKLHTIMAVGAAVCPNKNIKLTLDTEKISSNDDVRFRTGVEYTSQDIAGIVFSMRAGYSNVTSFTAGLGAKFKIVEFNYGFVTEKAKEFEDNHRFSLIFRF